MALSLERGEEEEEEVKGRGGKREGEEGGEGIWVMREGRGCSFVYGLLCRSYGACDL